MTPSLLVMLAIAVPMVCLLIVYAFSKGTSWVAMKPRLCAVVLMAFGPAYASVALPESVSGFTPSSVLFMLGGAMFFAGGVYHWFREKPVKLG